MTDRKLTPAEAIEQFLPTGPCCCDEHKHDWYERINGDEKWIECSFCAEAVR